MSVGSNHSRAGRFDWLSPTDLQIIHPGDGDVINFDELRAAQNARAMDEDRPSGRVVDLDYLRFCVENDVGTVRRGTAGDGKKWSTTFEVPYGYLDGTVGADGDSIDAFLGEGDPYGPVFVIHQNDLDGYYDEAKVMIGFDTPEKAKQAYWDHYDRPERFFRSMDTYTREAFDAELQKNGGRLYSADMVRIER